MAINRKRASTAAAGVTTETIAPIPFPATPTPVTPQPALLKRSEKNGYLDPDQTLINFAIRESGMSFRQLLAVDPHLMLRKWLKLYRASRTSAIGGTVTGGGSVLVGVTAAAPPLVLSGIALGGICALLIRYFGSGVRSCEEEYEALDEILPVLELLAVLQERGADASRLVSLYDRLIRQLSANGFLLKLRGGDFSNELMEFFQQELRKDQVLSGFLQTPTSFTVAATTPPAPTPQSLPSAPLPLAGAVAPTEANAAEGAIATPAPVVQPLNDDVIADIMASVEPNTKPPFVWLDNPTSVPLHQRAHEVITFLDGLGFPIGIILNTCATLGYGSSQSGKSTILHLSAILRLAQGGKVAYVTPDSDLPPIRYTQAMAGSNVKALRFMLKLAEKLDGADKGVLKGWTFFNDEWKKLASANAIEEEFSGINVLQRFLDKVFEKGDKTEGQFWGAAQVATLTALKLEGVSSAMSRDFLTLNAQKLPADSFQKERASGVYLCDRGYGKERWETPACLKKVIRPDGKPDPILSMLEWFPELRVDELVEPWLNACKKKQEQPSEPAPAPAPAAIAPSPVQPLNTEEVETAVEEQLAPPSSGTAPTPQPNPAASGAIISCLSGKPEGRSLEEIYKSGSVRQAMPEGKANKAATQETLNLLISQGLVIQSGEVYRLSDQLAQIMAPPVK